jgi:hypothetical protein
MNIYLSFLQSKITHPIPAYSFWEYYIKNGIAEGGYEWQEGEVDWAEGLMYSADKVKLAKWKAETWEKTLTDIEKKHSKKPISFFLSYLYPHQVEEQAIKAIQKMGIPCVNFFCDNVREFTEAPKEFFVFDLSWVPEYKAVGMYKKAGYNYLHLPMPMWIAPQHRQIITAETNEISFIGSRDVQRWLLFEEVVKKGLDVNIYGSGWKNDGIEPVNGNKIGKGGLKQTMLNQIRFLKRFGMTGFIRKLNQRNLRINASLSLEKCLRGKPVFDDYIRITKESAVTLGINRYPSYHHSLNNPDTYSRLRDIEAPMLGACYLTEWTDDIDTMYEIGKEIEIYKTTDELLEKVGYLLTDEKKREMLRKEGQKRALQNHGIAKSLQELNIKLS